MRGVMLSNSKIRCVFAALVSLLVGGLPFIICMKEGSSINLPTDFSSFP